MFYLLRTMGSWKYFEVEFDPGTSVGGILSITYDVEILFGAGR